MKKYLAALLLIAMSFALVACNQEATPPSQTASASSASVASASSAASSVSAQSGIEITDLAGTKHVFAKAPERVVVIEASQCEIVYALDAGDKIIALGTYCDYPEVTREIKKVGSGSRLNVEEIVALQPDCVLMGTMASDSAQAVALSNAKIPVVVIKANSIAETYENIATIGKLLDKNKEAANVVAAMKQQLAEVQASAPGGTKPKVYYEVSPLSEGPWSCGSKTFQHELIELAGGVNIFADLEGWQKVSEEQIIERNPDIIITSMHAAQTEDPAEEIMGRTGWEKIAAVASGKVYKVDANIVSRAAPRLAEGALALRDCLQAE